MKGTVKFYNADKGFGFLIGEDGKDYFVHKSGLNEGVALDKDESVTFDVTEGDRGPKAVNVGKNGGESKAADDSE